MTALSRAQMRSTRRAAGERSTAAPEPRKTGPSEYVMKPLVRDIIESQRGIPGLLVQD
jgi:hypothetical protein